MNVVGVIMDKEIKNRVVDVGRKIDRVIELKLIFEAKILNVVSAHAPQVGCEEKYKEVFW